jgi:hypothetical protein
MPILIAAAIVVLSVVVYFSRHRNPGTPPRQPVKQCDGKVDDSRTDTDERQRGHADLAALLGAVAVIVLTLNFAPGAWGYTSTIVGAVVLCVLIAFFARHPSKLGSTGAKWGDSIVVGVAFAALVGIVGAITGAELFQDHAFPDNPPCRAVGVNAATNAVHDLTGLGFEDVTPGQLKTQLKTLIHDQLNSSKPLEYDTVLGSAFSEAYQSSFGDCQAGKAEDHLYWIALPLFVGTLIWWVVTFRKARSDENTPGKSTSSVG